jgi:large subunit ribosomal protein L49
MSCSRLALQAFRPARSFIKPSANPTIILSHARYLTTEPTVITATETATTVPPVISPSQPSTASKDKTKVFKPKAPDYLVSRTPSNNLPVYQLRKRGGNKKLTYVKKIDGNREGLSAALEKTLGLRQGVVRVNQVTKHVVVPVSGFTRWAFFFFFFNKKLVAFTRILSNCFVLSHASPAKLQKIQKKIRRKISLEIGDTL